MMPVPSRSAATESLLEQGLHALGLPVDQERLRLLWLYVDELERWKDAFGLVKAEGQDLIVRHILDSLAGLPLIEKYRTGHIHGQRYNRRDRQSEHPGECQDGYLLRAAADLGSGGGLPGIPLALFMPEVRFLLVERSGKKAGFLRNAIPLLGLFDRAEVAETEVSRLDRCFDAVFFRAFAGLPDVAATIYDLLSPGGYAFAYKGRLKKIRDEVDSVAVHASGLEVAAVEPVAVPFLDEERHMVVLHKHPR